MTRSKTIGALVAALTLATSCDDPYDQADEGATPTPPPGEQPAPPLPTHPDTVASRHLAATPEQAARRAAVLTTNWTGPTAATRYAEFARMTVGAARRDARESAARLPTDPQLAGETRSTGAVEVIATRGDAGPKRGLIVVSRETLTGDGLREHRWRVTLATAEQRRGGWVISRWEPQP